MGIFSRLRDIVNSNINSMLDKAEEPEKMIRLMIQEMEDTLVEIKANCASAMADCKAIERKISTADEFADKWQKKAELAIRKGHEDLAREALLEKRRYSEESDSLTGELNSCREVVERYREDIRMLEDKLVQARDKHKSLTMRHRQAADKMEAGRQVRHADSIDALKKFESFERRVDRMEAEAGLANPPRQKQTLEEKFADLEKDDALEEELNKITREISGN